MHPTRKYVTVAIAAALSLAACSGAGAPEPSPSVSARATSATPPAPAQPYTAEPAWSVDIGSESWSQPAAVGDIVMVGANDGVVRGIDPQDGSVEWELQTEGAVRGGILADAGRGYLVSDDGRLYAIEATGEVAWTAVIDTSVVERTDYDNYGSRPTARDGVVYAASYSGTVVAVDQDSGAIEWSASVGARVETGLALAQERLHVSTMDGRHLALSLAEGAVVWESDTGGELTTTPAVMGDVVLVGNRVARLLGLDEATGERLWLVSFGGSWVQSGPVAIDEERFVVGSSDYNAVRAFDAATGKQEWQVRVGGWTWPVPAFADGVVYASEIRLDYQTPLDTALWAIDADTGAVLWKAGAGAALEWAPDGYGAYGNGAGPVVAGEFVIVPGLDGVVRAFDRS